MLGFIGTGAMGGAICRGILQAKALKQNEVGLFDISREKSARLAEELGVRAYSSCEEMVARCEMVLLAVKPNVVAKVLSGLREDLAGKALISIAAGWTAAKLAALLDPSTRILRVMPNTPALVGEGMTAFSRECTFTDEEKQRAEGFFSSVGRLVWVEEKQIDAVVGVSGSGPAYAYMFIEAMADGGVAAGLPRAQAQELAAQTLLGSARMVLESGLHPGALKDMVCSPGGTTIAAVRSLEKDGMRGAVIDAVLEAAKKAGELA